MKRVAILGLALVATLHGSTSLHAAPTSYLTPVGGYIRFEGDELKDAGYGGARLGIPLVGPIGFQIAGGYSPTKVNVPGGGDVTFMHVAGDLTGRLYNLERWDLYALVGGGYVRTKPDSGGATKTGSLDMGGGLHWWLAPHFGINLEVRNILLVPRHDDFDSPHINHVLYTAGLAIGFGGGKVKDSDGDGVADRKDKCPATPAGARVDATGCPTDADGDGVFDGLDQCADTPKGARVDAKGCPTDADGDGVFDGLDQCPDTPRGATVDAKGCPTDSDGDGVVDGLDQCPNTPQGAKVDAKGCPTDEDNDGVVDGLDKCPGTAAGLKVDATGCPIEVTEKETELLDTGMIRLQDVNFETGKADILPESYPALDVVGTVLGKWPELKIEVGGHTDSRGSAAYNQKLSEARAKSVVDYLTQKFPTLQAGQFTSVGYGESKPVAPNTNALNMAKNRRVEFKVLNRDVLKRESERRRQVPK